MKSCYYCGASMKDQAVFCPKCGEKFTNPGPSATAAGRPQQRTHLWLVMGLLALIVVGGCVAIFFIRQKTENPTISVQPKRPAASQAIAPNTSPIPSTKGPAFSSQLSSTVKQALIVQGNGSAIFTGQIALWEQINGRWQKYGDFPVVLGTNGFAQQASKREGDNRTPTGIFSLGTTFGYSRAIDTKMPYRQLTSNDYWVDDVSSAQYNRWVNGVPQARSYEQLLRSDSMHKYGVVINFNTNPVIVGRGSAIFLHVWRSPEIGTAGGVAMSEDNIVQILRWLDPVKQPAVLLNYGE